MAKYVFIYHTPRPRQPPRLPPRSRWRPSWGSGTPGAARVGDRLIDFGTPLAGGTRVTTEGTSPSTRDVAGYSHPARGHRRNPLRRPQRWTRHARNAGRDQRHHGCGSG